MKVELPWYGGPFTWDPGENSLVQTPDWTWANHYDSRQSVWQRCSEILVTSDCVMDSAPGILIGFFFSFLNITPYRWLYFLLLYFLLYLQHYFTFDWITDPQSSSTLCFSMLNSQLFSSKFLFSFRLINAVLLKANCTGHLRYNIIATI